MRHSLPHAHTLTRTEDIAVMDTRVYCSCVIHCVFVGRCLRCRRVLGGDSEKKSAAAAASPAGVPSSPRAQAKSKPKGKKSQRPGPPKGFSGSDKAASYNGGSKGGAKGGKGGKGGKGKR